MDDWTHAEARAQARVDVDGRVFDLDGRPLRRALDLSREATTEIRVHPAWGWALSVRDGRVWVEDGDHAWSIAAGTRASWLPDAAAGQPRARGPALEPYEAATWVRALSHARARGADERPALAALDDAPDHALLGLLDDRHLADTAADVLLHRPWAADLAPDVARHPHARSAALHYVRDRHPPWGLDLALQACGDAPAVQAVAVEIVAEAGAAAAAVGFDRLVEVLDGTDAPARRYATWLALARLDARRAAGLVGADRLLGWQDRCGMQAVLHEQAPPATRRALDEQFAAALVDRIAAASDGRDVADDAWELASCPLTRDLAARVAAGVARTDAVGEAVRAALAAAR